MIKKLLCFSIFILLICYHDISHAEDNKLYGFGNILFGTSYDDVLTEVKLKYEKKYEYVGISKTFEGTDHILMVDFSLGDWEIDVLLLFDHNRKFYSFHFKTKEYSASEIDPYLYQDLDHLTEIFKNKYGKPMQCVPKPNILGIHENYISTLCKWKNKDLKIFTGLSTSDFKYFAVGYVTSKTMEKSLEDYKKEQDKKKATEGANDF